MKTQATQLFVLTIIDGEQDKSIIEALRQMLLESPHEEFEAFLERVSKLMFRFHCVGRGREHLWVKNLKDTHTNMAVIMPKEEENFTPETRRWTREELRRVKKCFPYPQKWNHLDRVLRRSWQEIEEKALEIGLTK